jgi:predicted membrane chloride channel (bestrophin family)
MNKCGEGLSCYAEEEVPAPTWKELQELERTRREILRRAELPFCRILSYWTGTCLRALAFDGLVWVTVGVFVIIRISARLSDQPPALVEQLGDTDLDIIGGFLSFLLVLFVNQTNSRFFAMYQLAKKCSGQVQDVAGLATAQLPKGQALRLIRYMNAAQVTGYVGLGGPYTKNNCFNVYNKEHKLLNSREMARVEELNMDSGAAAFKELVTWCQKDVGRARKAGLIDAYEANEMQSRILALRGAMDGIYDYCAQPTHFFYIHFLCLLSALYLPLFAVDNAFSAGWGADADWGLELLNGLIVLLQAIFVVGLRVLGQVMVDPFGADLEDLSVITYVSTTIENSHIIMSSQQDEEVDVAFEEQLFVEKEPIHGHIA